MLADPDQSPDPYDSGDPRESDVVQLLQQAESINPSITVIASPWTAPPWMKSINTYAAGVSTTKNEKKIVAPVTLLAKYYGDYAQYLVDFIDYFADQRINITYITVQNEPDVKDDNNKPETTYPGMVLSSSQEATFINQDLAPRWHHLLLRFLATTTTGLIPPILKHSCRHRRRWSGQLGTAMEVRRHRQKRRTCRQSTCSFPTT